MKNNTIIIKNRKLISWFFMVFLAFNFSTIHSQSVNLSGLSIFQKDKLILLHWNIDSGPTCNGMSILHSTDMIIFNEIGNISGICGNSSSSTSYNFTHSTPVLNQINYYKIRLGTSQFSEIIYLYYTYVEPGNVLIKPNPANDVFEIKFNNDKNLTYTLEIIDSKGRLVLTKDKITGTSYTLNSSLFETGTYSVILRDENNKISKNKLCIIK